MSTAPTPWPARFALLALFWGSTFLFIKIGDEALAPLQVSFGRVLVGTATLLAILGVQRATPPDGAPHLGPPRDRRDPPERRAVHPVRLR